MQHFAPAKTVCVKKLHKMAPFVIEMAPTKFETNQTLQKLNFILFLSGF